MAENFEDEQTLKNRIILREATIRKLTSKYVDLTSKFNSLTRPEMASHIKEILNECDMLDISIIKAENLSHLKEIDSHYQSTLSNQINSNVEKTKSEIITFDKELLSARYEKEYKISCEEVAKIINSYNTKESLQEQICILEDEISKMKSTDNNYREIIEGKEKKLCLLMKLVGELKMSIEDDLENVENKFLERNNKMLID